MTANLFEVQKQLSITKVMLAFIPYFEVDSVAVLKMQLNMVLTIKMNLVTVIKKDLYNG
jgi:hypothetical protein